MLTTPFSVLLHHQFYLLVLDEDTRKGSYGSFGLLLFNYQWGADEDL